MPLLKLSRSDILAYCSVSNNSVVGDFRIGSLRCISLFINFSVILGGLRICFGKGPVNKDSDLDVSFPLCIRDTHTNSGVLLDG